MNTNSWTWIFASNNEIIYVINLIFILEINFSDKISAIKRKF